ncbi:DNA cytosine methyltransferase [Nocardiopsis dassonvillei]|uniref:DNA cytosine methyltransferase n=1 Tax=Nocardiopsis dassonvillei TaxID=2014 RepID=UPI00366C113A
MVQQEVPTSTKRTGVELFAGGGGLALGVHNAGFRPLLVNEFAKRACETLRANGALEYEDKEYLPEPGEAWPLIEGDVRDVKFGYLEDKVDLLAGGPPCQPFSLGGAHRGVEDERNMFPQFFRAMREIRPRAFVCENVRGLLRPSFDRYFKYILNELRLPFVERDGGSWEEHNDLLLQRLKEVPKDSPDRYDVVPVPVNAADYGVPQIRRRVIIVGFRADLGVDWSRFQPKPTHSESSLIMSIKKGDYWNRSNGESTIPKRVREAASARYPDVLPLENVLQPWRTLRDALEGIDGGPKLPEVPFALMDRRTEIDGIPDHVGWPGARIYDGHTPNELDRPAKTVKAGVHGVPGGESVVRLDDGSYRYMTVRETARVMTFPDEWRLAGPRGEKMRQLGNAVPVLLAERFAQAISDALDSVE